MTQPIHRSQTKPLQTKPVQTTPFPTMPCQTTPCLTMPDLKELVIDASHALAHLDVNRLEELALSCEALNRDLNRDMETFSPDLRRELADQAKRASADLAVFARVIEATRSNIKVMRRLSRLRAERLEYKLEYKHDLDIPFPEILDKRSARGID